mmetsp:Transcript_121319/g.170574  ORF Transcript_121319/g.170574 Transcript_121319/m.170574 type:complete len:111 (-) Transcript_121319:73-405(-)|eukprot:symbB.v1.2.040611.t1/scaffold7375.1/size11630/2
MAFDPGFFNSAYRQCIGRGLSHKECVSSLPGFPSGPMVPYSPEMSSAMACLSENGGDFDKCTTHFDALAGKKEEETKSTFQQGSDFCSKAGWKLLALPVAYVGLKFIKIK